MSYTQHTWIDGETITASKLNNIEEGIGEASQTGGGGLVWIPVTFDSTESSFVLSMTAQQIVDGMSAGTIYGVKITEDVIPEGWGQTPRLFIFYYIAFGESYINLEGDSWSWGCSSLSEHPTCYIGD